MRALLRLSNVFENRTPVKAELDVASDGSRLGLEVKCEAEGVEVYVVRAHGGFGRIGHIWHIMHIVRGPSW